MTKRTYHYEAQFVAAPPNDLAGKVSEECNAKAGGGFRLVKVERFTGEGGVTLGLLLIFERSLAE